MTTKLFSLTALLLLSFIGYGQMSKEYTDWVRKANDFYNEKQYRKSADAYSQAFAVMGGKGAIVDRYNAACIWSLAGNKDSAFFQLNRIATKANFTDYKQLTEDDDLVTLHKDKRWNALCKLVKQNKDKAEAHLNKPLVATLDSIFQFDQQGRNQIRFIQKEYGSDSKEMKKLWETISYNDSVDLIKVTAIVDKYGWLGPDVVGEKGSQAIFLVIQHANIKTQDKYLPMMREAVKNKKASASSLALLEDRVAMRHGRKQIYGSQILSDAEGSFLSPLEDPDNVDKRRADVGLDPLANYLENFGLQWNLAEYKAQLPGLEKRLTNMHFQ